MRTVHAQKYVRLAREFGPKVCFCTGLINAYPYRSHPNALGWRLIQYYHRVILSWLNKHYGKLLNGSNPAMGIEKFEGNFSPPNDQVEKNRTIWTMWWQGRDNAPELVRACLSSIDSHRGDFDFVCLDQNNITQYINLPDHILSKFKSGSIKLAHLSDIVRMYLLYHYGGLWLDATTYVSCDIESDILMNGFFTCKDIAQKNEFVSRSEWAVNTIGMEQGRSFSSSLLSCFYIYWYEHDAPIAYLMFDYLISLSLAQNVAAFELFKKVPINNTKHNNLVAVLNAPYDPSFFEERPDTYLYKLNWKRSFHETSSDGKETFYYHLLHEKKDNETRNN